MIVGAGASGSVLAARLAEEGRYSVILIEAGPDNTEDEFIRNASRSPLLLDLPAPFGPSPSPSHWGFITDQNGKRYNYPRGTGLGGSTNHHPLVDGRGSPKVYDEWAKITHHSRWKYQNLIPFFTKMENYLGNVKTSQHGRGGWLDIKPNELEPGFDQALIESVKTEIGAPYREDFYDDENNISGIGLSLAQIHPDGTRSNAAVDLLKPILNKSKSCGLNNLIVMTNTLASKIFFKKTDQDLLQAIEIEAIHQPRAYKIDAAYSPQKNYKKIRIKARKEIIISCGAINTPQLLMLSGIGPKEQLAQYNIPVMINLEGLGRHLQDHIEVANVYRIYQLPNRVWRWQTALLSKQNPKFNLHSGNNPLAENAIPLIIDWFSGVDKPDPLHPDIHIHCIHAFFRDFNLNPEKFKEEDPLKSSTLSQFASQFSNEEPIAYQTFLIESMKPGKTQGNIQLQSLDPTDPPIIDLRLYESAQDIARLTRGIQMMRKVMKNAAMQQYSPEEILPGTHYQTESELAHYIQHYSSFGHHISGTAKMGNKNDESACVDPNLKVFGTENLRICDTSIFPSIPAYNTSRAAYMVGEVLASIILSKKH